MINPDLITFPSEGPNRLLSLWSDAVLSGALEYYDNQNRRRTEDLDKLKGISMGASIRYNVVPTSIGKVSVHVQVKRNLSS